jgi:hypothetical protein
MNLYNAIQQAPIIEVGEWQGQIHDGPQTRTAELEDVTFATFIPEDLENFQHVFHPNLPWAEDHFRERVSGEPLNPPPSSAYWPWTVQGHAQHAQNQQFSHTYPERYWPKYADRPGTVQEVMNLGYMPRGGIRYRYGDLSDVVKLLHTRPYTRQAYLPVWFPEDTGAVANQRVPCSLGYHFMIRENRLTVRYFMRSCDLLRHFRDDVYLTARLAWWIAERLPNVTAHAIVMHISSLHAFEADLPVLRTLRTRMALG